MDMPTDGPGVLVIGDTGAVSWWSSRVAAVPPVDLAAGPGIVVRVDPTRPGAPLAWAMEPDARTETLAVIFGDTGPAAFLDDRRHRGETVHSLESPRLTVPWTRRAMVAAAVRWTVRPVDNGALLLDEAMTEQAVGHRSAARQLFIHAEYALRDFVDRCIEGEMPTGTVTSVRRALEAAESAGLGGEIAALRTRLAEAAPITDAELRSVLTEWAEESGVGGEVLIGDPVPDRTDSARNPLDLAMIPPRILAWQGRHFPELLIEHRAADETFVVSAALAAGVDPFGKEAREFLAYCADNRTGTLVAVAPARATEGTVVAELPDRGRELGSVVFGLAGGGSDLSALRCDPIGRTLADIDRGMVEAWNQHRAAIATLSAAAGIDDAGTAAQARIHCDELLLRAQEAVGEARRQLAELLGGLPEPEERITGALTARLTAVDEYAGQLWNPVPVAVDELLLLESIAPRPDEE